ncbi:hypothetical protein GVV04_31895 [Micromonospora sp. NEAU-HG-1]|nr:hypothetical protein [Micromonospora rubida]
MDDRHGADGHGGANEAGKRVEYFVVGKRGGIAEFREADVESRVRKTDAATLAFQLGVEETSLPGRRFSCWVAPDEYGVTRSDFRIVVE